jgi:hypothetical protein
MANRNWSSAGKIYSMHTMPVLIDCNFVVDSTNGNGLGIRSLKGPTVAAVYMHTSASPATGNPNPGTGTIVVQLADNYNRSLSGFSSLVSPLNGTPTTTTAANAAQIITSLGTATLAQWQAVGFPIGMTPAVGAAFIATATGTIGGSATVELVATTGSNITDIETVGDPNQTISSTAYQQGAQVILQCYKNGAIAAPVDGTVISLAFYLSNSSVQVAGE